MPDANRSNVAALIPCYREERRIRDIAARTLAQLDTVLVVDDGSADRTAAEAEAAGAEVRRHERNQGKGGAIKTGLRALTSRPTAEWILILDGDGQHLPEEIDRFLAAAQSGADLIVGDRMADVRTMPFIRKLTNRTMSWLISKAAGQSIPDSQCGFRMFTRELATAFLQMASSNFDFESEMLVLASRRGAKIAAAPVSTIYGDEVSKIHPVRDTIRFFQLLERIRAKS
jgi:glycosyltransferase involved in cell wall biosynthesis